MLLLRLLLSGITGILFRQLLVFVVLFLLQLLPFLVLLLLKFVLLLLIFLVCRGIPGVGCRRALHAERSLGWTAVVGRSPFSARGCAVPRLAGGL